MASNTKPKHGELDKPMVKKLLGLAQSDRERECIRYTLFKVTGLISSYAQKQYRFENMAERAKKVESCLCEVQKIREAIDNLAAVEDTAFLATLGITPDDSDESDCDEQEETQFAESTEPEEVHTEMVTDMTRENLKMLIESSQFNWFDLIEKSECLGITAEVMASQLEVAMSEPSRLGLDGYQLQLLLQSKQAFSHGRIKCI